MEPKIRKGGRILLNLLEQHKNIGAGLRVAVAGAADQEVVSILRPGHNLGLSFILIGNESKILSLLADAGLAPSEFRIVPAEESKEVARLAVELIRAGEADILMKGLLTTAEFMRPALDAQKGLRTGRLLSHVAAIELPGQRLVLLSDAALNIAPGIKEKTDIIRNAAMVAKQLGYTRPKAALLAASEEVDPAMPATIEAAALAKMAERGQICLDLDVDGPLALDNAISMAAAQHKGIHSKVAGLADILIVPDITCGNLLYKALVSLAGFQAAGVVVGSAAPIVLTSRTDRSSTKLNSLGLAAILANNMND